MNHTRPDHDTETEAARLIAAAYADDTIPTATHYRDPNPPTPTGAQPVPQPGARTPMSQRAADITGIITAVGIASLPAGGGAALTLWALSTVDPVVLAIAAAAPVGLVGALGIAAKMIGRAAKETAEALPPGELHNHFDGTTYVQAVVTNTHTRGLGRTVNQIER